MSFVSDDSDIEELIRPFLSNGADEPPPRRPVKASRASRAAVLDALAGVLAATRVLLEVAEDAVRSGRDRLLVAEKSDDDSEDRPPEPPSGRIDLTY